MIHRELGCEQLTLVHLRDMRVSVAIEVIENKVTVHRRLRLRRPTPLARWTRLVSASAVVWDTTQIEYDRRTSVTVACARRRNDACHSLQRY